MLLLVEEHGMQLPILIDFTQSLRLARGDN